MFNLDVDLRGVTEYFDEIQKALQAVGNKLGQVKINDVTDPVEVARAVAKLERMVDRAFEPYTNNPTVRGISEQMKASYKRQLLKQVELKKLEINLPHTNAET